MRRGAEAVVGGKGGMIITKCSLAMDGMKKERCECGFGFGVFLGLLVKDGSLLANYDNDFITTRHFSFFIHSIP